MMPETDDENSDRPESRTRGIGEKVVEIWLRAIRLYTYNTPISKGKYRLYQTALNALKTPPQALSTRVKDGRNLIVDLTTGMQETVFFIGEYERAISEITSKMIGESDVCLDVGANFGWYTTLMAMRSGKDGAVHSFEPVPKSFAELKRNRDLLPFSQKVHINNVALGDRADTVHINLFDGLSSGHASLATRGESGISSFECRMIALDSYLEERNVGDVAIVKVDIEGAEMMFLRGANRLFEQEFPPVFLMEMALGQTRNFGYVPDDLIRYIGERAEYAFFKVDEIRGKLVRIDGFDPNDIGANVFCIPVNAREYIHATVGEYLTS
ncbi:MAG: FkbM family methyltransferase [Blastocatellia bacterium]